MRIVIFILVFLVFEIKYSYSICDEIPNITFDTLSSQKILAHFEYSYNPMANFSDTLYPGFIYDWIADLYSDNYYVFHGKIISAEYKMDTVPSGQDTILFCYDAGYELSLGQAIGKREHVTKVEVLESFKGEYESDTIAITEKLLFPLECFGESEKNPYTSLVGEEFYFFNLDKVSFPQTGPHPDFHCQQKSGFFIDSIGFVEKFGYINVSPGDWKISREYDTGYPGVKIEKDSIVWAFENYTNVPRLNLNGTDKHYFMYLNSKFKVVGGRGGEVYSINGRVIPK